MVIFAVIGLVGCVVGSVVLTCKVTEWVNGVNMLGRYINALSSRVTSNYVDLNARVQLLERLTRNNK